MTSPSLMTQSVTFRPPDPPRRGALTLPNVNLRESMKLLVSPSILLINWTIYDTSSVKSEKPYRSIMCVRSIIPTFNYIQSSWSISIRVYCARMFVYSWSRHNYQQFRFIIGNLINIDIHLSHMWPQADSKSFSTMPPLYKMSTKSRYCILFSF